MMVTRGTPNTKGMRWLAWLAAAGLLAAAMIAPATVVGQDGNNGTVKIHEGATETEPGPQNEPHVCTFHLHFFFADPFQSGSWEIQSWPPTGDGTVVLSGDYDTEGTGEDRAPADGVYELPDGHYKLFWDGDDDKHDKHKVFWVACGEVDETTTTTTDETTVDETTTTVDETTTTTDETTTTVSATTTTVDETTTTVVVTTTTDVSGTTTTITLPPTSTIDPASGGNSGLISFGLLLLALGSLVVGLARPLASRKVEDR